MAARPSRDHGIDRLRAWCLISMTVGHLATASGQSSLIDRGVHAPVWVSGAAGFVFLSGTSIALFWRSRGGASADVGRWMLVRGLVLAALAVVSNLVGIAWFGLVGQPSWYPTAPPTIGGVLLGRWSLLFVDVLWMYAVFLVALAAVGRWLVSHPLPSLAASLGIYAVSQFGGAFGPTATPDSEPVWNLPAWQLVFTAGFLAGTYWSGVRRQLHRHRTMVWSLAAIGLVAIAVMRIGLNLAERGVDPLGVGGERMDLEDGWLDKAALRPIRLLLIAAIGPAAYLWASRASVVDPLLLRAGGRSLRVYLCSTLLAFALAGIATGGWSPVAAEAAIIMGTVLVLASGQPAPIARGRPWSF